MLAGTPEDPVCEGAVMLVNPVEYLGIDLFHIILVKQAASAFENQILQLLNVEARYCRDEDGLNILR